MPTESTPDRVRRVLLQARDRLGASDPGLGRLRTAASAATCVATILPVQAVVGSVLGYASVTAFSATLFGAVVAMLASNALAGAGRRTQLRTAAFFPVAVAAGLLPAAALDGRQASQVLGFVVVLFGAVWVRRFGPAYFFYGFMAWMGFFFATFLQATWSLVPELLLASVVSTLWTLVLTTTIFRAEPRRVLRSALGAYFSHARGVAREAADLLEVAPDAPGRQRRAARTLAGRVAALAETALVVDSWSAGPQALPPGWSAAALRRRTIEAQQATERFARGATTLASPEVDPALRAAAARTLDHLAHRRDAAAVAGGDALDALADRADEDGRTGGWPARHVAHGVREFLRLDAAVDDPPLLDPGEAEFEAATDLVFGNLPGAPAVAREVAARGSRWNPLLRLSLTSRQAVQVAVAGALAIALGSLLSPTRYYWAVIAAFVTFAGTGTRSETFLKGAARIGGTLAGIAAAILLAHVTVGRTPVALAIVVLAIFAAFYVVRLSYAAMTFFVTIVLGQLYVLLGTFSDGLLALRLGETAVGAVAGVVVALLLAPLSTSDTVRSAQVELLVAMRALLDAVATYAGGGEADLDSLTRALDDRARRMALVARPLTRPVLGGAGGSRRRRELGRYVAAVSMGRATALAVQQAKSSQRVPGGSAAVAQACRALAEAARLLAEPTAEPAAVWEPLERADRILLADRSPRGSALTALRAEDAVVGHLHHLAATLGELAGPRPGQDDVPQPPG